MTKNTVTARHLIALERRRQVGKGFDAAHDDHHKNSELRYAAAAHLLPNCQFTRDYWPFAPGTPPPAHQGNLNDDELSNLVKAAAMIEAEIERRLRITREGKAEDPATLRGRYTFEVHNEEGAPIAFLQKSPNEPLCIFGEVNEMFDALTDLVSRHVNCTDPDKLAEAAYTAYRNEVPFGTEFVTWQQLTGMGDKKRVVEAWRHAARAAVLLEVQSFPIPTQAERPPAIEWVENRHVHGLTGSLEGDEGTTLFIIKYEDDLPKGHGRLFSAFLNDNEEGMTGPILSLQERALGTMIGWLNRNHPIARQAASFHSGPDFKQEFRKSHSLLRVARQIAAREGRDTNWEAWRETLQATLTRQEGMAEPLGHSEPKAASSQ